MASTVHSIHSRNLGISTDGNITLNDVEVTSTAAELNILDGVTATAAELNYLDITTLGTGAASKAVVLDASGDYTFPASATIVLPSGGDFTASSGSTVDIAGTFEIANVAMTASAAELNYNDIATLGTGAASKAVVLSATAAYTFPASHTFRRSLVALTATAAITALLHSERTLYVTGTAAAAYTLPEATGTGDTYRFYMGQVNVNGTTFVAADTANCSFHGTANLLDVDGNAQTAYFTATAGGTDTVTFNGTTTGGRIGDMVTFTDLATDVWHVHVEASVPAGSNVATPFSSAA